MTKKKALVVGLGIAGMSAAVRLAEIGWEPIVIERAPARRTGGYMVGMFPEGIAAAERLGVNDSIVKRTQENGTTLQIDRDGARRPGPGFIDQPGAPEIVLRGDIEAGLWRHVEDADVEVRFGTAPVAIDQEADGAVVTLRVGATGALYEERFDLVVGADGMRSSVRRLAFGPHEDYLKPMNAMICAFQTIEPLSDLRPEESVISADPRRALWVFSMRDTAPTVLFTYRTKNIDAQFAGRRSRTLRRVYAGMTSGGVVPAALDQVDLVPDTLFDSVNQVRMDRWHAGRVVLVGDAAWCLTLYSGMGATAGMLGGSTLGDKLAEHPDDVERALAAYDAELRPFMTRHQRLSHIKSQLFVPSGRATWWIRRQLISKLRPGRPKRLSGARR